MLDFGFLPFIRFTKGIYTNTENFSEENSIETVSAVAGWLKNMLSASPPTWTVAFKAHLKVRRSFLSALLSQGWVQAAGNHHQPARGRQAIL